LFVPIDGLIVDRVAASPIRCPFMVKLSIRCTVFANIKGVLFSPNTNVLSLIGLLSFVKKPDQNLAVVPEENTAAVRSVASG